MTPVFSMKNKLYYGSMRAGDIFQPSFTVDYVVVAGGGGAAATEANGGGAAVV
jgi:hypothetical protein